MIEGEVSCQGALQGLIAERLGQGTLEIIMDGEAERQQLISVLAENTARKMQIEFEDGRLCCSEPVRLRKSSRNRLSLRNAWGLNWRSVTLRDLLLSLDAKCASVLTASERDPLSFSA